MNKITKALLISLLYVSSSQLYAGNISYSIKIKIKGLKDTVCYLANHFGDKQYLKDTARIDSKGNLTFDGKDKLQGGVYMVILDKNKLFEIIVTEKEQNFSLETDTTDYVKYMKIKNSVENTLFFEYLNFLGSKSKTADSLSALMKNKSNDSLQIRNQLVKINDDVNNHRSKFIINHKEQFVSKLFKASLEIEVPPNPNPKDSSYGYKYYKKHYFDNIDFTDDKILRTPIFHQKIDFYIKQLVIQTPDSINKEIDYVISMARANKDMFKYCVWFFNYTYETSPLMGMDAVFVHMAKKYYLTKDVDWIDESTRKKFQERYDILKNLLIGLKAPEMYLQDTLNQYKYLSSIKEVKGLKGVKAKLTLVSFWDPDCGHCQKEIPKLYDFYIKNRNLGIEVYSVTISREPSHWKKFIRDNKIFDWVNVWDGGTHTDFRTMWDIYSTPVLYILDENKKIIAKRIGTEQLEDYLSKQHKLKIEPSLITPKKDAPSEKTSH